MATWRTSSCRLTRRWPRRWQSSEAAGLPAISVSPMHGQLLQMLAQLCGARHILEIGTLGGYSTIWLARALPPDGRLMYAGS